MSVFSYSLQLALGILLPWSVVRGDLRRLTPEQLRRTWNPATFWCAIVVFGPLCIPVHFVKARRTVLGFLLGVACMGDVLLLLTAADLAAQLATRPA
ncbi:MAG TPA: hypothetical protein VI072_07980 [Polyangiaceae bacterium]